MALTSLPLAPQQFPLPKRRQYWSRYRHPGRRGLRDRSSRRRRRRHRRHPCLPRYLQNADTDTAKPTQRTLTMVTVAVMPMAVIRASLAREQPNHSAIQAQEATAAISSTAHAKERRRNQLSLPFPHDTAGTTPNSLPNSQLTATAAAAIVATRRLARLVRRSRGRGHALRVPMANLIVLIARCCSRRVLQTAGGRVGWVGMSTCTWYVYHAPLR